MSLLAGVAAALLHVGLAEALGGGLVADPLGGAAQLAVALLALGVAVAAVGAVVALPPLYTLATVALGKYFW